MRKKLFDIRFEPNMQPGFETRYKSLDSMVGEGLPTNKDKEPNGGIFVEQNLRNKFKSQFVPQLTPSVILRKKGK